MLLGSIRFTPNPAYETAEYELDLSGHGDLLKRVIPINKPCSNCHGKGKIPRYHKDPKWGLCKSLTTCPRCNGKKKK
jgi:DnaJ-class molecular chaperone